MVSNRKQSASTRSPGVLSSKTLSTKTISRLKEDNVGRLVVALSGGADSVALLHMVVGAGLEKRIAAIHINHGLMKEADQWQDFCEHYCNELAVPLECISVDVPKSGSLEASARRARYAAFNLSLKKGDLLLMAHHADDQVETILLNLFRGSEAFGVRGMPLERKIGESMVYRPLLDIRRQDIVEYCRSNGLAWAEDASNRSLAMDRNYLRHELLPQIEKRFPASRKVLLDAVVRDKEMTKTIAQLALEDYDTCKTKDGGIQLGKIAHIGEVRQVSLIRTFLQSKGISLPTGKQVRECIRVMHQAKEDTAPLTKWSVFEMRLHNKTLYVRRSPNADPMPSRIDWCIRNPLHIAGGILSTKLTEARSRDSLAGVMLDIRFRSGGEKIKLHKTRTLKNLFQENRLPVWLRSRVPLIYHQDQLVAIPSVPTWGVPPVQVTGVETLDGLTFQFDVEDRL